MKPWWTCLIEHVNFEVTNADDLPLRRSLPADNGSQVLCLHREALSLNPMTECRPLHANSCVSPGPPYMMRTVLLEKRFHVRISAVE